MTDRLGDYELQCLLGRGGAASVYRAVDLRNGDLVALKVLSDTDCSVSLKRFEREARALSELKHPHIVGFREIGRANDKVFLALQFIDGCSLEDELKRLHRSNDRMPPERIVEVELQLLSALYHIEGLGLCHRDVKPANILIEQSSGRVFLGDFGLARFDDLTRLTKEGHTVGTIGFMSPEQVLALDVDHRSDIYQAGLILYCLAYGPLPRSSSNAFECALNRAMQGLPIPEEPLPMFGNSLAGIIEKACAREPEARYQSARLMADEVAASAAKAGLSATIPCLERPGEEQMRIGRTLTETAANHRSSSGLSACSFEGMTRSTERPTASVEPESPMNAGGKDRTGGKEDSSPTVERDRTLDGRRTNIKKPGEDGVRASSSLPGSLDSMKREHTGAEGRRNAGTATSTGTLRYPVTGSVKKGVAVILAGFVSGFALFCFVFFLYTTRPWRRPFTAAFELLHAKRATEALSTFDAALSRLVVSDELDDRIRERAASFLSELSAILPENERAAKNLSHLLGSCGNELAHTPRAMKPLSAMVSGQLRFLADSGRLRTGEMLAEHALAAGMYTAEVLSQAGRLYRLNGSRLRAAKTIDPAWIDTPAAPGVILEAAVTAERSGLFYTAEVLYERSLEEAQDKREAALSGLASLLWSSGSDRRRRKAVDMAGKVDTTGRRNDEALKILALSAASEGLTTRAVTLLSRLSAGASCFETEIAFAECLRQQGLDHLSIPHLKKALEFSPGDRNTLHKLMLVCYCIGDDSWNEYFTRLGRTSGLYARWYADMTKLNNDAKGNEGDEQLITGFIERWPFTYIGKLMLSTLYIRKTRLEEAASILDLIERTHGPSAPSMHRRAMVFQAEHNPGRALKLVSRALRSAPRQPTLFKFFLSLSDKLELRYEDFLATCDYVLKYDSTSPLALANKAEVLSKMGRFDEAIEIDRRLLDPAGAGSMTMNRLRQWLDLAPTIRTRLCAMLFRAGRWNEGLELVSKLLKATGRMGSRPDRLRNTQSDRLILARASAAVHGLLGLLSRKLEERTADDRRWFFFGKVPPDMEKRFDEAKRALALEDLRLGRLMASIGLRRPGRKENEAGPGPGRPRR